MVRNASKCRSCGAKIFWYYTASGKLMPVDAEPCADGNLAINYDGTVMVVGSGSGRQPRYRSHFATCPNAARHRRQQKPCADKE
jgi:hypothetical protein